MIFYQIKIGQIICKFFKLPFFTESGKGSKAKNKLPGISNWFEWSWPLTGEYAGCIQARDIANLGAWKIFFPKDLEKLQSKIIEKPSPNISTPSIPKNTWTIPLPNDTGFVSLL